MKKSQTTSLSERANVNFPLWRKKVDNSLFRHRGTAIPRWVSSNWGLEKHFPDNNGKSSKRDPDTKTKILFSKNVYFGNVTCTVHKNRKNKLHRLWIPEDLLDDLKNVFLMSHMRDLESALRGDVGNIEKEIPFWEFLDIEFDGKNKLFIFTAHYKQESIFPSLFGNLVGSPALKNIEDEIGGKDEFRIHKQDWKERKDLDTEIGAINTVYTLIDKNNKLLYVGEAVDLRKRLKQRKESIPNWTHYRYDTLPKGTPKKIRVGIERMTIRSFACLFTNNADIKTVNVSNYKLVNEKIDKNT